MECMTGPLVVRVEAIEVVSKMDVMSSFISRRWQSVGGLLGLGRQGRHLWAGVFPESADTLPRIGADHAPGWGR